MIMKIAAIAKTTIGFWKDIPSIEPVIAATIPNIEYTIAKPKTKKTDR